MKNAVARDYVLHLRDFSLANGISTKTLLQGSGQTATLLLDPPEFIDREIFRVMINNMFATFSPISQGVLSYAKSLVLSCHGPLGIAIQGAQNLKQALPMAQRYFATRAQRHGLDLVDDEKYIGLAISSGYTIEDEASKFALLLSFVFIFQDLFEGKNLDGQMHLDLSSPQPDDFPEQALEGIIVNFSSQYDRVVVPTAWANIPFPSSDPELLLAAQQQCEKDLELLFPSDLLQEIHIKLAKTPTDKITLAEMASQLHVSPSTLQRRLREYGVTFKALKSQLKLTQAKHLLAQSQLSLEKVSEQLGFCDASAFAKSFKTFAGMSPSQYRKQLDLN